MLGVDSTPRPPAFSAGAPPLLSALASWRVAGAASALQPRIDAAALLAARCGGGAAGGDSEDDDGSDAAESGADDSGDDLPGGGSARGSGLPPLPMMLLDLMMITFQHQVA